MATFKEIKKHYWACEDCMKKAGGTAEDLLGATCLANAVCGVCNKLAESLIPWVDYDWPKEDSVTEITAKLGRD